MGSFSDQTHFLIARFREIPDETWYKSRQESDLDLECATKRNVSMGVHEASLGLGTERRRRLALLVERDA